MLHIITSARSPSPFALLFVLLGASSPPTLWHHLLLDHVDDLIWDSQILDSASSDVALRHSPELISILWKGSGGVTSISFYIFVTLANISNVLIWDPSSHPHTTNTALKTKHCFTREVQMTSLRLMFIQLSQLTRWPLYVSPFFNSTNCGESWILILTWFFWVTVSNCQLISVSSPWGDSGQSSVEKEEAEKQMKIRLYLHTCVTNYICRPFSRQCVY